jgi:hypothetical protein
MLGASDMRRRDATRELREQVKALLRNLSVDTVVVTEIRCQDLDCPDAETVIVVLRRDQEPVHAKIPKRAELVTEADLCDAVRSLRAGLQ